MTMPEDWVLLEAAERANIGDETVEYLRKIYPRAGSFRALCDMIQKYEKKPVDRKVLCAQEAVRLHNERHVFSHGLHTPEEVCIRAIELYEGDFGK